jgi:hypothetical protein
LSKIEKKTYEFLKDYDENQDGRIAVSELKIEKFAWNLKRDNKKRDSKSGKKKILREIIELTQNLQREMINYL